MTDMKFILPFDRITAADHGRVGGKCASLGDMTQAGVAVPPGYAVTTEAYEAMLNETGLRAEIEAQLARLDFDDVTDQERAAIRAHPAARAISLGPRILRGETAALAGIAVWMAEAGDWIGEE